jgi:hypothetical protein
MNDADPEDLNAALNYLSIILPNELLSSWNIVLSTFDLQIKYDVNL